jgi:DNA-binding GntR family transcriptional regulator
VTVDPLSPEPLYVQLAAVLRQRIGAGEWNRGPLPSNRQLRQAYGVGEYVVTHALRVLEKEGLVFTVPRRGVYVRQQA